MAAANNEFFEALSMLEHERGITAEYLIEKIKAAIVIAVKKNYEVEDDHVMVEIDPNTGKFNVALIQDVVADEDWYDEHSEIGITEAQHIRKSYQVGDRVVTPLKTKDFGRIAAQTAKHVVGSAITGIPLFTVFDAPFKETISALSGFVITIEIPFAVSMLDPPPTATIKSALDALHFSTPSKTFFIVGFGFTSEYTSKSIPSLSKILVTLSVTPTSTKDLSVTTKTFLNPLDLISSGSTSLAPFPK